MLREEIENHVVTTGFYSLQSRVKLRVALFSRDLVRTWSAPVTRLYWLGSYRFTIVKLKWLGQDDCYTLEIWCYRKMLNIERIERIANEAVSTGRSKENKVLWCTIKVKRYRMVGHLLRHDSSTISVV